MNQKPTNINYVEPNEVYLFDTCIFIFYFQWANDKLPIRDLNKGKDIKIIFEVCEDHSISLKINFGILTEIKRKCKSLNLFYDETTIQNLIINNLLDLKDLSDNDKANIIDWYEKEEEPFDIADMHIYYLNQIDLNNLSKYIFTDNIRDFVRCQDVFKKYHKEYGLVYIPQIILGIEDMKDYLNKNYCICFKKIKEGK